MKRIVIGVAAALLAASTHAAEFRVGARVVSSSHVATPQPADALRLRISTHGAATPLALVGNELQLMSGNGDLAVPAAGSGDVMVTLLY